MKRLATILAVAAILPLSGCQRHTNTTTRDPITVKVLSAKDEGALTANTYVGTVEAGKSAVVRANNSGTLTAFTVKAGDTVKEGQVIAKVESQSVQSAYNMAKATLEQAQDGYDRVSKVYDSGSVAEVKMVEIKTDLAKAKATFEAASRALDQCSVKSPFTGMVGEVLATEGSEVGIASPLIRLVSVSTNEIHFPVPESELASVRVGEKARVEIPAIGRTVDATVASKGVVASQMSHSYECVLSGVSRVPDLMPGMVCKIRLYGKSDASMVIPATAVMTDANGRYVWTVDSEYVVGRLYVTVTGYSGTGIVVCDSFPEGMRVIVEGSRKVSTGMKVKTVE